VAMMLAQRLHRDNNGDNDLCYPKVAWNVSDTCGLLISGSKSRHKCKLIGYISDLVVVLNGQTDKDINKPSPLIDSNRNFFNIYEEWRA
jgi:hypothetical protein